MPNILSKIFSAGAAKLVGSIGEAIDRNITSKDEREKNNIELQKIITSHIQAMEAQTNLTFAKEVEDRASARSRETDFIKAAGHIDYLMWFLAISAMGIFGFMIWKVIYSSVPSENRELIFHIFGIVEGVILSVFGYYFGSSANIKR